MIVGMTAIDGVCILIVEDNEDARKVVAYRLRRMGVRDIREAANGREALAAVHEHRPDLILMDMMMPVMDGYEAIAAIRALPGDGGSMPIIALTAACLDGDRERCLKAGADDYVAKPVVDPRVLTGKISYWLERRSAPAPEIGPAAANLANLA